MVDLADRLRLLDRAIMPLWCFAALVLPFIGAGIAVFAVVAGIRRSDGVAVAIYSTAALLSALLLSLYLFGRLQPAEPA